MDEQLERRQLNSKIIDRLIDIEIQLATISTDMKNHHKSDRDFEFITSELNKKITGNYYPKES